MLNKHNDAYRKMLHTLTKVVQDDLENECSRKWSISMAQVEHCLFSYRTFELPNANIICDLLLRREISECFFFYSKHFDRIDFFELTNEKMFDFDIKI